MSGTDDGDRPVTVAELADLRSAVDALQAENAELKRARTEPERAEARAGVREAQADLDAVAASLGISREALDKATRDAKAAERKEELRPILRDLVTELREEEAAAEAKRLKDEAAAAKEKRGTKDKAKDKPADRGDGGGADSDNGDGGKPDDGPERPHWSERALGNLVK